MNNNPPNPTSSVTEEMVRAGFAAVPNRLLNIDAKQLRAIYLAMHQARQSAQQVPDDVGPMPWEPPIERQRVPDDVEREVEALIEEGFSTVSRNPSDWEATTAWRYAIRKAVERRAASPQPDNEVEDLKHDLERQMTIANIECNEVERLRGVLEHFIDIIDGTEETGFDPHIEQMLMDAAETARTALATEREG